MNQFFVIALSNESILSYKTMNKIKILRKSRVLLSLLWHLTYLSELVQVFFHLSLIIYPHILVCRYIFLISRTRVAAYEKQVSCATKVIAESLNTYERYILEFSNLLLYRLHQNILFLIDRYFWQIIEWSSCLTFLQHIFRFVNVLF